MFRRQSPNWRKRTSVFLVLSLRSQPHFKSEKRVKEKEKKSENGKGEGGRERGGRKEGGGGKKEKLRERQRERNRV